MARAAPGTRADYVAFRELQTRWMDNDAYGHMNNATYFSLFDTAVSLWQLENGLALTGPGAVRFLVVENTCRYHAEIGFPDQVTAGLRIGHIGRSSFRYDVALFRNAQQVASAEGTFAQVNVGADGRPAPLPETVRRLLETLLIPGT